MGRDKPTHQTSQVLDVNVADPGIDPQLWAYMASFGPDSSPWLYNPLLPMDPESFNQMQQQHKSYNNYSNPWYDLENLKAMAELPLQQPQSSVWGESDGASPNSQHYVLSDSRDSSPCVSANAPSEADLHKIGENFPGFVDEFKTLPLVEQQKILAPEGLGSKLDLSHKVELHEIFMNNVSRIQARVFQDSDNSGESPGMPVKGLLGGPESPNNKGKSASDAGKEDPGQEAESSKKSARRGVLQAEELPYSCTKCGVGCRDKTSLRKHMYVHQPRRYFCDFGNCGIGFHTKRDLRRHMDTKHRKGAGVVGSRVRRKSYICKIPACERGKAKPFSRRDNARQHVVGVHGIKNSRGEAEKVIEEIDVEVDDDVAVENAAENAPEQVEESKASSSAQKSERNAPENPTNAAATAGRAPALSHRKAKSAESEDLLAEFTTFPDLLQDKAAQKRSTGTSDQTVQPPRQSPGVSLPGNNVNAQADSTTPLAAPESDDQYKLIQQPQQQQQPPMPSLYGFPQTNSNSGDLDKTLQMWEQMAKIEAEGGVPPIDPSRLFDELYDSLAGLHI